MLVLAETNEAPSYSYFLIGLQSSDATAVVIAKKQIQL